MPIELAFKKRKKKNEKGRKENLERRCGYHWKVLILKELVFVNMDDVI